jgi:hypothetical protein
MRKVKWRGIDVYIHHISYREIDDGAVPIVQYVLVSKEQEKRGLFKIDISELEEKLDK